MIEPTQHIQISYKIPEEFNGIRLDQACAKLFPEYSRTLLQKWIKQQYLTVNGEALKPKDKVFYGQLISINAPLEKKQKDQPQYIQLDILFEDEAILLINKPAGLVVHPGAGNPDKTLVNALLHYLPSLNQLPRAGIIHRLDKNTSGIMLIPKHLKAFTFLVDQLQKREIKREYEAVVNGVVISGGSLNKAIGRHPVNRVKMAVIATGKEAITHYRKIETFRAHTHLRVFLETGRTHQIRVHMAHLRYPIVGDPEYGKRPCFPKNATEELMKVLQAFPRQALHARQLSFLHPTTLNKVQYEAPLPTDIIQLIQALKKDRESH
jgi:23S rRNA pseudouridine1911/1915/1917 synthase